ncbi:hypothetical protein PG997_006207 [Apiospora hydei]|uniref:REJ domain-containing protein n=1 Tax=Apiospora hydei TaxID=1337664 RepID=A0ABR1WR88_9PEZI
MGGHHHRSSDVASLYSCSSHGSRSSYSSGSSSSRSCGSSSSSSSSSGGGRSRHSSGSHSPSSSSCYSNASQGSNGSVSRRIDKFDNPALRIMAHIVRGPLRGYFGRQGQQALASPPTPLVFFLEWGQQQAPPESWPVAGVVGLGW